MLILNEISATMFCVYNYVMHIISRYEEMCGKGSKMNKRWILASGSPRRKELLAHIVNDFEVLITDADEKYTASEPVEIVRELAEIKGSAAEKSVSEDCVIISADTIVVSEGRILGKPCNRDDAFNMLKSLCGKSHCVYTGVSVIDKSGDSVQRTTVSEMTKVYVDEISDEEINRYIETGDCFDKAGGYGIQGLFSKYISGIEGDYFNVVGFPVNAVYNVLKKLGYNI